MSLGLDAERYWSLTPRELTLLFKGANRKLIRDHDARMTQAWHTARLAAYPPAKSSEFVKLEALMYRDPGKTTNQQTADQQLAIARSWVSSTR